MKPSLVYFIRQGENGPIKIGKTTNILDRLAALQTANWQQLNVIGLVEGGLKYEESLHWMFEALHIRGEWFKPELPLLSYIAKLSKSRVDNLNESISKLCACGANFPILEVKDDGFIETKCGKCTQLAASGSPKIGLPRNKLCKNCGAEGSLRKGFCQTCAKFWNS